MAFSTSVMLPSPKDAVRPFAQFQCSLRHFRLLTHFAAFVLGVCLSSGLLAAFSVHVSNRNRAATSAGGLLRTLSFASRGTVKSQCDFPLVYNKPPKTAGTYVQKVITDWTKRTGRPNLLCRGKRAIETAVYLHECLPRLKDANDVEELDRIQCSVLNVHLYLTPESRALLNARLPQHRLITSTRYPPHRIVSFFLQLNLAKADDITRLNATENVDTVDEADNSALSVATSEQELKLHNFLRQYNPWALYNFHTGEHRKGACPLRHDEKLHIFQLAGRYDLVVDANLPKESNAILRHHKLFTFPDDPFSVNVRGATRMTISKQTKQLIRDVSCVEDTLHKALHIRMASLYEEATGRSCIQSGRVEDLTSCLDAKERKYLMSDWLID